MTKAFTAHKENGIYLKFPNGNAISTIWGGGSYTENHDYEIRDTDGKIDVVRSYSERIADGSDTVEVMVTCSATVLELLEAKYGTESAGGSVFGHLTLEQWLDILDILKRNK